MLLHISSMAPWIMANVGHVNMPLQYSAAWCNRTHHIRAIYAKAGRVYDPTAAGFFLMLLKGRTRST
jgi:hypothetical protein